MNCIEINGTLSTEPIRSSSCWIKCFDGIYLCLAMRRNKSTHILQHEEHEKAILHPEIIHQLNQKAGRIVEVHTNDIMISPFTLIFYHLSILALLTFIQAIHLQTLIRQIIFIGGLTERRIRLLQLLSCRWSPNDDVIMNIPHRRRSLNRNIIIHNLSLTLVTEYEGQQLYAMDYHCDQISIPHATCQKSDTTGVWREV